METFTITDQYGAEVVYSVPVEVADLTDEIMEAAIETADAWFPEGKIEWEDVWDRMEGYYLPSGMRLSWGSQLDTPAMRKVQREVRKVRAQG